MSESAVDPSEPVSRFLLKPDLRPDGKTVKHSAFLPPSNNLKLSIFRVSALSDQEVWALASEKVEPKRGPVIGRADLSVSQIIHRQLKVCPDGDPTSRHADIIGWPEDRGQRGTIAMDLAADASPAVQRPITRQ